MKNISLSLLFMCLATAAFAQFGIKAGVNTSRINTENNDIEDLKARLGFQVGAMFKLDLSDSWAIQPEAVYVRKGSKYNTLGADVKSTMNYLDVPVVLVFNPYNLPISFHAGPQFSYLLNTDVTYESTLLGKEVSYEVEKNNFEDYDFGFAAGLAFTRGNGVLEFRYTQGLKEYEKDSRIGNINIEPSSKHYNLQASIGYYF